jgi:hypothetical protein
MFAYTKIMQALAAAGIIPSNADPYFNLTTLLLNTTTTNGAQNNTFLDSGTANGGVGFSITRSPATGPLAPTQGTFSPFSQTGWSVAFNTSTTYLTAADTANIRFGSADFTVEAWVYRNTSGVAHTIAAKGTSTTGWVFSINASNQLNWTDTSTSNATTDTIPANTWTYVSAVRTGGNINLYINAVLKLTFPNSTTYSQTSALTVGAGRTQLNSFDGYISNLRFSNTARSITSTPTSALTADSNTIFLALNSNNFYYTDSTAAYVAMTPTGTPSVQAFEPFAPTAAYSTTTVGGSGYFDVSDYLTVAGGSLLAFGNGDFSLEAFVYPTSSGINMKIYDGRPNTTAGNYPVLQITLSNVAEFLVDSTSLITGTTVIPANAWTHVLVSRVSGNLRLFINGVQNGSTISNSTNFANGTARPAIAVRGSSLTADYFNGYISDVRVLIGSGFTSVTVPTAPLTPIPNTSLLLNFTNAGIYDAASKNVLETVGNAQVVSPSPAKFGTTSIVFDGTGDYLLLPDSPNLQLSTGDFTIEGFVYLDIAGVAYGIISKGTATTGWSVNVTSGNKLQFSYTATQLTGATSLAATTWYYFAVVRSGSATGNLKLYIGTSGSTTLDATSAGAVTDNFNQTNSMYVGASRTGTTILDGYLDEIRITKGYARTVTTVPTAAFPIQ